MASPGGTGSNLYKVLLKWLNEYFSGEGEVLPSLGRGESKPTFMIPSATASKTELLV